MRVLVCGGAGFIGSHMVLRLAEDGHTPITVDNLSNGHRDAVLAGNFHHLDIRDTDALANIIADERIDAVIHFAAFIEAGISMKDPLSFWDNNVSGSISLLKAMYANRINKLVFSSTAALFGNPSQLPITEQTDHQPVNPYGATKLAVEEMLKDADRALGIRSVCLRYFNAAGADPQGRLGERHDPETHLIPLAIAAAQGTRDKLTIFGNDYPTPDGTCVRDYIHVCDLVDAHIRALDHLMAGKPSQAFNLGTGRGFSVKEVVDTVSKVTGLPVPHTIGDRREGDPASLVADSSHARVELGWVPQFPKLEDMVAHAWAFSNKSHNT